MRSFNQDLSYIVSLSREPTWDSCLSLQKLELLMDYHYCCHIYEFLRSKYKVLTLAEKATEPFSQLQHGFDLPAFPGAKHNSIIVL